MQNFFTFNATAANKLQRAYNKALHKSNCCYSAYNACSKLRNANVQLLQQLLQQYVQQYAAQHNVHNVVALNIKHSYASCINARTYAHALASVKSVYALHKRPHYKNAQHKAIAHALVKMYYIAVRLAYLRKIQCMRKLNSAYMLQRAFAATYDNVCKYDIVCTQLVDIVDIVDNNNCYAHYINTLASYAIAAVHSA